MDFEKMVYLSLGDLLCYGLFTSVLSLLLIDVSDLIVKLTNKRSKKQKADQNNNS